MVTIKEKVRVRLLALYQAAQQTQAAFDVAYATALESLDLDPKAQYRLNLETGEIQDPSPNGTSDIPLASTEKVA